MPKVFNILVISFTQMVPFKPQLRRERKKEEGKIADILSIINEIPLGKHKTEVAIKLREAMLTAVSEAQ